MQENDYHFRGACRIGFTFGYVVTMLLHGLLVDRELGWWLSQLEFLGTIHFVWWVVLIIKWHINTIKKVKNF